MSAYTVSIAEISQDFARSWQYKFAAKRSKIHQEIKPGLIRCGLLNPILGLGQPIFFSFSRSFCRFANTRHLLIERLNQLFQTSCLGSQLFRAFTLSFNFLLRLSLQFFLFF